MQLLSPWSGIVAAAVAIPLLVLLYLLKLRRRPARVASTLLWRQSFEDLQVNAPFQRLRWSALLAVQLLALVLLILAFAEPVVGGGPVGASRIIILLDRSASMNTIIDPESGATRFDQARAQARETIDRLGAGSEPARCMIIAFAGAANVFSGFETDTAVLRRALEAITPTDEPANLQAALEVAGAFAQQADESGEARTPRVLLFSDGCVGTPADPGGFVLRSGRFEFIRVAESEEPSSNGEDTPTDNLGITAFAAERDFEDPVTAKIFTRLTNGSPEPVRTVLTIRATDETGSADADAIVRTVVVPGRTDAGPGSAGATAALPLPRGGVLLASHAHGDALPIDNTAALVLPPPSKPRLALVHPVGDLADRFLIDLLDSLDADRVDVLDADAFAAIDPARLDTGDMYDLIVFDRVSAQRLGSVPTLSIGALPAGLQKREPADARGRRIATWQRQHPIMRHVQLDDIVFARFGAIETSPGVEALASGPDGPVIALVRRRSAPHIVVGFELLASNWSIDVSFTVFMLNVLDQAMLGRSGRVGRTLQPGESYTLRPVAETREITIAGPEQHAITIEPDDLGQPIVGPRLSRAGVYTVDGAQVPFDTLTVSVVSEQETDNQARASVRVNAQQQRAGAAEATVPRPVWPYLLMAAAVVLVIEWLLWCGKTGGWTRSS